MATPHVAGIAALWLESQPGLTPDQLESALQRTARRLPQSASAVGAGLVQAP
jgi:subtilisin family serine protease